MKIKTRFILLTAVCLLVLLLGLFVGSVGFGPGEVLAVLAHKVLGLPLPETVSPGAAGILWNIRLPRVLTAFGAGAGLSLCGAAMQSVLGNPLASSYTLGVSSGASLGAALAIMAGVSVGSIFLLPLAGFSVGLITVLAALALAARIDKGLRGNTIILVGMVVSLFANALLTLINALRREYMQQLLLWQMGSFASKTFRHAAVIGVLGFAGLLVMLRYSRAMDLLTFGDEAGRALGLNTRKARVGLLLLGTLLTGSIICFTGTIGFVDLVAPHMMRRLFGPQHRRLLPASALFGGAFMTLCDLVARTVLAPQELPVGAVTALIGAPFFAWVYFAKARGREV